MNQFIKTYQSKDNSFLLKIIDNPEDYQPLAVEAAKHEIEIRNLNEIEISEARKINEFKELERKKHNESIRIAETKVKNFGQSIAETFNPIQRNAPTTEKLINLISISFAVISGYQLIKEFGMFQFLINDKYAKWDFSVIIFFLPILYLPLATFLFWKRKKIGWILLTIFITYTMVSAIAMFILTLNMQISHLLEPFSNLVSPAIHILTLIFFGGALWAICRNPIRELYRISLTIMIVTIGATATIIGLIISTVFH